MGGLASNVVYIASSLAAGNQPITASPALPAITISTPPAEGSARGYVILDVPKFDGAAGTRSLSDAIAEEMKRYSLPPGARDLPPGGSLSTDPPEDLDNAVVASHEARIAAIKDRIETLRTGKDAAAGAQLRDLATRLKRAEAARKLAAARLALGEPPRAAPRIEAPALEIAKPTAARALHGAGKSPTRSIARRTGIATARQLAGASRVRWSPANAARPPLHRTNARTTHANNANLDRARRLLTIARKTLTATDHPPLRLAGLWQWAGSENWSLTHYPKRIA